METKATTKIKTLDELAKTIDSLKKKGKSIVQCHGVFDIVHLGHIRHFGLAKKEGDILIVTLTADRHVKRGPGRPIFNHNLRAETLASLEVTDFVSIVDEATAITAIKKLRPNVYVKGSEYANKEKDVTGMINDEEAAITSVGGRLAFTNDITFSSSKLINESLDVFPLRTQKYLKALSKRYTVDDIQNHLNSLEKLKVLVIGDTIIDEYHYCDPMGKSSKSDVVVNSYNSEESFAGGVLATANNTAEVCGKVDLITVLGTKNSHEDFIRKHLKNNINPLFFYRKDVETTVKRRFVRSETGRKLFEICYMDDHHIEPDIEQQIMEIIKKNGRSYDAIIVSDFGHGMMTPKLIKAVRSAAKYLAVNAQTNGANAGFNLVTKYPKPNCVCIDEVELRFAAQNKFADVRTLLKNIYEKMGCEMIIATRGNAGSMSYTKKEGYHECPAFTSNVIDAVGAGDAFFAFIAPSFAKKMSPDVVSFIGNTVGALAVQIICNRHPVNKIDLIKFMTRLLK